MSTSVLHYDEPELVGRLSNASPEGRALFAAASAERLFPLYERYAARTDQEALAQLRAALDAAWEAVAAEAATEDLARWQEVAEALVPDEEDEGWVEDAAYGQNAAAAVAYALRTRLTGDPQEAGWAARQIYDAADYAAQRQIDDDRAFSAPGAEEALLATPVVQEALRSIQENLALVADADQATPEELARLKQDAHDAGQRLAQLTG
ncbi:MAG: hypothetical protein QOD83_3743 [Solirubrobacteraceae bacterium]|nr:hypothetical protein [Solirubrobacteraceae bacterium]